MDPESTATEQPAESLTDAIEAAFDSYEETPEETPEAPEEPEVSEAPEESAEEEPETPEAEEQPEAEEETEEAEQEQPEETGTLEPPENWAAEDKERFNKLAEVEGGADAQQFLLDRHKAMEGDYTRKMQEIAPLRDYEQVHQMFQPYMQELKQQGLSPAHVIQNWANIAQNLQTNPAETIQWLAEQNQIDLDNIESHFRDPQVSNLEKEVQQLRTTLTQREQAELQARQNSVIQDIQSFAEEKTEAGEPAHPYFNDVIDDVVALAQAEKAAGREPKLKELYDKAVWMNPSIRDQMMTSQRKAEEKRRQEEARQKAAKAKQAGKSVTGSPGGQAPAQNMSLREQIEQGFNA